MGKEPGSLLPGPPLYGSGLFCDGDKSSEAALGKGSESLQQPPPLRYPEVSHSHVSGENCADPTILLCLMVQPRLLC
jgi:hypothetical protein